MTTETAQQPQDQKARRAHIQRRLGRFVGLPLLLVAVCGALFIYLATANLDEIERRTINAGFISQRLVEHIELAGLSTILVIAIAVPLGILLTRPGARRLTPIALAVANIGQAVPSIGLLVLLALTVGVGFNEAIIALVVYSVLPVLRNTMVGLQQVDYSLIEAGRGMGMTRLGVLVRIELPLAVPVILAGIRTALVINVGTATLATFVDGGGLGDLINNGLRLSRQPVVLAGGVLTAVLALFIDWLAGITEEVLRPRGL
jgi:osmoprotectant transport system permease protein